MSSEVVNAPKSVQDEQNVNHFHCKKCKTFFRSKAQQEKHVLLVHVKEKNIKCDICQKPFGYENNLRRHVKTVHGNTKNFPCNLCEKHKCSYLIKDQISHSNGKK